MAKASRWDEALVSRVRQVVAERFDGNASAAARACDVHPNLVLRVVRDGQTPPPRLLVALAERGLADPRWLLTGRLVDRDLGGPQVPLLDRLLPVPLAGWSTPDWVATVAAPPALGREGVYAYRARSTDHIPDEWRVTAGDLVFIDTGEWARRAALGQDSLVVWRWSIPASPGGKPAPAKALFGEVRHRTASRKAAKVFGEKVRSGVFEPGAPSGGGAADPPELLDGGRRWTAGHLAGVVLGVTRVVPVADPTSGRV